MSSEYIATYEQGFGDGNSQTNIAKLSGGDLAKASDAIREGISDLLQQLNLSNENILTLVTELHMKLLDQISSGLEPKWAWNVTINGSCPSLDTTTIDLNWDSRQGMNDFEASAGIKPLDITVKVKFSFTAFVVPVATHLINHCSSYKEYEYWRLDDEQRRKHNEREREARERYRAALEEYRKMLRRLYEKHGGELPPEVVRELEIPKFPYPNHPEDDPYRGVNGPVALNPAPPLGRFKERAFTVTWACTIAGAVDVAIVAGAATYTIPGIAEHCYFVKSECCGPE